MRLKVTPSAAPEAVPSKYGSASGFLNTPCAIAPARPNIAPANHAPRVRGRRMSYSTTRNCASPDLIQSKEVCRFDVPISRPPSESTTVMPRQQATQAARFGVRVIAALPRRVA